MTRGRQHVVSVALVMLSGCTSPESERAAQPAATAATVKELMLAKVIPASSAVFQVAATAPGSDAEWSLVRTSAVELTRSAEELLRDSASAHAREAAWIEACRILGDAGREAVLAAESRDVDAVIAAGDRVYSACEQCHSVYFPAPVPPS
jgi:hypothetical protein